MSKRTAAAPGRPLQFSPDSVVDEAMGVFWQHGFENTSMDDLQAATGLSRSSLYNTFGSKRALFERAMDRYSQERSAPCIASLHDGSGGLEDIDAFLTALVRAVCKPASRRGCFMVNAAVEFGTADSAVARTSAAYFSRVQAAFATALRRAARLGQIDAKKVPGRARLLLAIAMGINVQARAGASKRDLEDLLEVARGQLQNLRIACSGPSVKKSRT